MDTLEIVGIAVAAYFTLVVVLWAIVHLLAHRGYEESSDAYVRIVSTRPLTTAVVNVSTINPPDIGGSDD